MHLGELIDSIRVEKGHTKLWVAEQVNINYKTFVDKLKRDTFDGKELIRLAKLLNINLEELKDKI